MKYMAEPLYHMLLAFLSLFVLVLSAAVCRGQNPEPSPISQLSLQTASGRSVYLRGELVTLVVGSDTEQGRKFFVRIRPASSKTPAKTLYEGHLVEGHRRLRFSTASLGEGDYVIVAVPSESHTPLTISVRKTRVTSPGMILDDNGGGFGISPMADLAGQTGYVTFMTGQAMGKRYGLGRGQLSRIHDKYAEHGILAWLQETSRPLSFSPPHSHPDTHGEYRRRMTLIAQIQSRYPTHAGQLFDYDPTGFLNKYAHLVGYWKWRDQQDELQDYMGRQEKALLDCFRDQTGMEPLTTREAILLGAATGSPECMGYIDMPTRKWAYQIARRAPEQSPAKVEKLRERALAWYGYLMSINTRRYEDYLSELRPVDPSLAYSTSLTMGHNPHRKGNDRQAAYRPLDFRFVSIWDDQAGAPEYIYETIFAAALLNGERNLRQPLWIDTVWGRQNGHHFRNSALLAGHGAQGTGYSFEMGSSLSYRNRGTRMLRNNSSQLQEAAMTARLMRDLGGIITKSKHRPRVGILFSDRNISLRPWIPVNTDAVYKAFYLLSHIGLPPAIVTERMLANGQPESMDALIVLHHTTPLSAGAREGLESFVDHGGRVISDTHTTMDWDFLERSDALNFPHRETGHPYNMNTAYNRQDARVTVIHKLLRERCPRLRALLMPVTRSTTLDCSDPTIGITSIHAGSATFTTVSNDRRLDLARLFNAQERLTTAYQKIFVGHGNGVLGSWVPLQAKLVLGSDVPEEAAVYDLLDREKAAVRKQGGGRILEADLTGLSARIYGVYPRPVGPGLLKVSSAAVGRPLDVAYQACTMEQKPLEAAVPVVVRLRTATGELLREFYRATAADGHLEFSLPTGLFDRPGRYSVEVRQLLDGRGVRAETTIGSGDSPQASVVDGVEVRNPESIRDFLDSQPELAIPVFDESLIPLAERVAAHLRKDGVNAQVWEQPPVIKYLLAYAVEGEQADRNRRVERGEAIGEVEGRWVTSNFYGTKMPGYRCGRPLLLLGNPETNPVLDAVAESGLLWRDSSTDLPGGGVVQHVASAMERHTDALVIWGTDEKGLKEASERFIDLPQQNDTSQHLRLARQRLMEERGLPLPDPSAGDKARSSDSSLNVDAQDLTMLKADSVPQQAGMVPVTNVEQRGEDLMVELGRWGTSLARVRPDGEVDPVPAPKTLKPAAFGQGVTVVPMKGLLTAWDGNGRALWRAIGNYKGFVPGTDDVIIAREGKQYRISPDASYVPFSGEIESQEQRKRRFQFKIETRKEGRRSVLESAQVMDTRAQEPVPNLELTPEKQRGRPWAVLENMIQGEKGKVMLLYRRFPGENTVQIYVPGNERPVKLSVDTTYISDVGLSEDEELVVVGSREGQVTVADLSGKRVTEFMIGPFPRVFPLPGGGFALGSGNGRLAVVNADGRLKMKVSLLGETANVSPSEMYAALRAAPLIAPSNPPLAEGALPLQRFYWYVRDEDGALHMVNWGRLQKTVDFRWMDAVQSEVVFPKPGKYRITVRAAAKYFDQKPLTQETWRPIVSVRQQVVKGERPTPAFRVFADGDKILDMTPARGKLAAYETPPVKQGWAILPDPTDDQLTTFTGTVTIDAGSHMIGLSADNMVDCLATEFRIEPVDK